MDLLILGYYGYDNLGDEMLLTSLLDNLKKNKDINCKVLTYNASETSKRHGVSTISRGKNISLIKAILNSDIVIVGGGSILQDVTSSRSLYYYLAILVLSKIARKKVFLLANGYGPVTKPFNKWLIRRFSPKIDGIISRDEDSYNSFKELGGKRVFSGVDLVYLSNFDEIKREKISKNEKPIVSIGLRKWDNSINTKESIKKSILYLHEIGYQIYLLPMKYPDDADYMREFLELGDFVKMTEKSYDNRLEILAKSEFVIGMRLHLLILSSILEKPFIGISYDPKVDSVIGMFYDKEQLDYSDITYEKLKEKIDDTIKNYDIYKEKITTIKNSMQIDAKKQMNIFNNWLQSSK